MKNIFKVVCLVGLISTQGWSLNITTWHANYETNEDTWIKVEDKPGNEKDWIAIYKVGTNNDWANVLTWKWAKDDSKAYPGWYKFDGLKDGQYEARFFLNNSYQVENKVTFSVGKSAMNISTWHSNYTIDDDVWLKIENSPGNEKDWIGIYKAGSSNDWANVVKWKWAKNDSDAYPNWYKFTGLQSGQYEARFFLNNTYTLADKVAFDVDDAGENKKYPKESILKNTPIDLDNPAIAPTKNNPIVYDNKLGTKTRFIVKKDNPRSPYAKRQAWNANMSLVRVGNRLYDAHTYKESPITNILNNGNAWTKLCSRASDSFIWSNRESNTFYAINSSNAFIKATINGNNVNCENVLDNFNDYEQIHMGPDEGNIDSQDKYVVLIGKKKNDKTIYVILYDIQNKTRKFEEALPASDDDEWNGNSPKRMDWISVSPSGKHIVVNNGHSNDAKNGMYVYDMKFRNKTKLYYRYYGDNKVYPVEGGHGDMGYDQQGNEVWVQFVSGVGVYMFNLDKPNELGQELLGQPYGDGHITCRNIKRKGYCYMTTLYKQYAYAFALKLLPDIDGNNGNAKEVVELFSQTYMTGYGNKNVTPYSFGGVSPDGTKMIFNTNLGKYETFNTFISEVK